MSDRLVVQGAREHNLRNVNLDLPRDQLIVFTGISGSGKSSLAFDTIYAEGQRRYVESLSSYARQFLGQMDKPDVDFIEGLSPAISIDQKSASRNPRSTVGTITEIYDYLRLLYARIGVPHDPETGERLVRQTPQQIVDRVLELEEGTRFQVLAPIVRGRKGTYDTLLADLAAQGFSRAIVDGELHEFGDEVDLARYEQHSISVVVDRLVLREGIERRLTESMETALTLAEGVAEIQIVPGPQDPPSGEDSEDEEPRTIVFSQHLSRPSDGKSFEELAPRNFSFNSPYGACQYCAGLGTVFEVDPDLVVPNPDLSLAEGAIAPWSSGRSRYFPRLVEAVAADQKIDMERPWRRLSARHRGILLEKGLTGKVKVRYTNRFGRTRVYSARFEGLLPYLRRRHAEAESDTQREQIEGYMRQVPCPTCDGARLNDLSLAVLVDGHSIRDICTLSIGEAAKVLQGLELSERETMIAEQIQKEINSRLGFLLDVGLDYLSLSRSAATLAGGEAQRIRLASQIGSGLVGVLYVLDEPSIGLHQRDNQRLIETLVRLRDLGNTVIVVEHDEETIRSADHVVDIGPGAGEHGGDILHSGDLKGLLSHRTSLTGQYLGGRRQIPLPEMRRPASAERLVVRGARENNLADIDVEVPLGCFVAVTGVSGSGKSTLVNEILHKALMAGVYGSKVPPGLHTALEGVDAVDKVINIDQAPIGRTPRSNAATYTGVFDHVRKLFAQTEEARIRGYKPGRFSFNVKGGRCDACNGDGTIRIEMHFLPDVYVPCEVCSGRRYNRDTLDITFKGRNIADVLDMPCEEALGFFDRQPSITRHMQTLVDVGLGYIRLGQSAPTLSGGEAQRIKLASELAKRPTGHTVYILDEPTTGLHFEDVRKLLGVLNRLVDQGNSVIVIEHNLDVVKTADWLIDLGPEGGSGGGRVVATGTPEVVATVPESHTGRYLGALLTN
ncbi:MAG TPA: excinuclease ABC subunit UvrA [Acidimicrobiales bacterium]|nr:excinuclease ABC subunit UvrA [Acidimicrobiales bacterium]MDP7411860.1 excinuclease ABC subunit UvrA [Acidimicrobiales bacterium]MEE1521686.1 excinuclease ABC subunit UvrA [Acidimicrobiales bacterium]HJL82347.1 excinuclease ABC subunit UvrA [Acidimicrobiales bacterium]